MTEQNQDGLACERCGGGGRINTGPGDYGDEWIDCPDCHGSGRTADNHDSILGRE